MKRALVLGAGGFIGSHLVKRLKSEGFWVRGVDLKYPEFSESAADEMIIKDLRDPESVSYAMTAPGQRIIYTPLDFENYDKQYSEDSFDEVYQLAADMGGAGYIFTGENDSNVMHNSASINLNVVNEAYKKKVKRVFYSSSACIYPAYNQTDSLSPKCSEDSAYPAAPDSEYGWEKLFSERLYLAYSRNFGLEVRIARFHNIYGPEGTWNGGKEKAPAAICRKVAQSDGSIEIWGDGEQTRSFLYIDDCIDGILAVTRSEYKGPFNIGSEEMITINQLVDIVSNIACKKLEKKHISGPMGVRGRNSDNTLITSAVGWTPRISLKDGLEKTYLWITKQL